MIRAAVNGQLFYVGIDKQVLVETCKICPFSLVCLSGKQFTSYICSQCAAIWIDEIKTLVDCDAFEMDKEHFIFPGCPACEPFEIAPEEITKIVGYCGKKYQEETDEHRAADEE